MKKNQLLQNDLSKDFPLAELSYHLISLIDTKGNIYYTNKAYIGTLGFAKKELLKMNIKEIIPVDDLTKFTINKKTKNLTIRLKNKKGEIMWVEGNHFPFKWKGKAYTCIILYDITERKKTEEELQESEEHFRTVVDNITQLAWMTDSNANVFWYNKRWYEYTGTTFEEMKDQGWQKVHHPTYLRRVIKKINDCFKTGEFWEDTYPLRGKNGEYRWFLSRAIPIRDKKGKIIHWFGTNTDITERRELEKKKDEFINMASHELKTPLTTIKAYAQIIQNNIKKRNFDKLNLFSDRMNKQLNLLQSYIDDLLDVNKMQAGKLIMRKQNVDIYDLIKEVCNQMCDILIHRKITMDSVHEKIVLDKERIEQVLVNLISNAAKYSPEGKRIIVKAIKEKQQIHVSVQDFGIGVPHDQQKKIFERFFQVEGEHRNKFGGLGLGLYISKGIIDQHHGKIWAESQEGKGSIFYFTLPL